MPTRSTTLAFVLLAASACGGSKPAPRVLPAEPAWAADYVARAREGCACQAPACLETTKQTLDGVVTAHGGLDEAPPSVHEAHGAFEKCWHDGTRDLARDVRELADRMCGCESRTCLNAEADALDALIASYAGAWDVSPGSPAGADHERLVACHRRRQMPVEAFRAMLERVTSAMCKCGDYACAKRVVEERRKAVAPYLEVAPGSDLEANQVLEERYCACWMPHFKADLARPHEIAGVTVKDTTINLECQ